MNLLPYQERHLKVNRPDAVWTQNIAVRFCNMQNRERLQKMQFCFWPLTVQRQQDLGGFGVTLAWAWYSRFYSYDEVTCLLDLSQEEKSTGLYYSAWISFWICVTLVSLCHLSFGISFMRFVSGFSIWLQGCSAESSLLFVWWMCVW